MGQYFILYEKNKHLYSTLKKYKPQKSADYNISFQVDNAVQEQEIIEFKSDLLPKLRKSLNNFHLHLNIKVTEQSAGQKAYTSQEKFAQMAEKNPELKNLKDQLGLEIDF